MITEQSGYIRREAAGCVGVAGYRCSSDSFCDFVSRRLVSAYVPMAVL